jgi:hypothetical protein
MVSAESDEASNPERDRRARFEKVHPPTGVQATDWPSAPEPSLTSVQFGY